MNKETRRFYEFGPFRLDPDKHRLLREGELVHVSPKAIDALIVLVQNPGKLLERDALMQAVWADTFVEDANLTVAISQLRKVLGQNGEAAEYIETIPRVGYRFVAAVREGYEQTRPLIIEKHTQSRTVIEEEVKPDIQPVRTAAIAAAPLSLSVTRRGILIGATALVILSFASFVYFRNSTEKTATASNLSAFRIHTLAVLPPKSLSNETENASLTLGIADALITRLGRINKLTVRPTEAVARFAGTNQDPLKAGSALGVDAILDGTLQRDGGRTRITLRLIDVKSGRQLWAANFDEADSDIFKLQDAISQQVGNALYTNLNPREEALLTRHQTTSKEAYALYLQGNYFWSKRGEESAKAAEYFRKAIALDPQFADAYVALAGAEAMTLRMPSADAEAVIEKALQLDSESANAHATYALIRMFHYWDWPTAERELDRAIELDPNSAVAHHWKGVYLSIRGRLDEAKAEMYRALDLDPMSLIIMTDIGQLHYFSHDYDQASDYCNRVLGFDPTFHDAHTYLIDIYRMKGMDKEALNELIQADGLSAQTAEQVRTVFGRSGLRGVFNQEVQDRLKIFNKESDKRILMGFLIARYYAQTGDKEQALKWLAIGAQEPQTFWAPYVNVDPVYDFLRGDPRFQEVLSRIGLVG